MDNKEINEFQISQSKISANSLKYFSLFDKHIPNSLSENAKVLIYDISNFDCILKIMQKNPKAEYSIYGNKIVNNFLSKYAKDFKISFIEDSLDKYDINMKFDCIIMNPPYDHSLHTNIFAMAQSYVNDGGSCVSLHPTDRYCKAIKNNSPFIAKNKMPIIVDDIEIITKDLSNKLFGIGLSDNLGIFLYKNTNTHIVKDFSYLIEDYDLFKHMKSQKFIVFKSKFEKTPSNYPLRYGIVPVKNSGTKFGFGCTKYNSAISNEIKGNMAFINSSSKNEQYNLWKTGWTDFMRFCAKIDSTIVPFMEGCVNPRTKTIGYETEWTNEDFFEYFNIPLNIQKKIIDFMSRKGNARKFVNDEFILI